MKSKPTNIEIIDMQIENPEITIKTPFRLYLRGTESIYGWVIQKQKMSGNEGAKIDSYIEVDAKSTSVVERISKKNAEKLLDFVMYQILPNPNESPLFMDL